MLKAPTPKPEGRPATEQRPGPELSTQDPPKAIPLESDTAKDLSKAPADIHSDAPDSPKAGSIRVELSQGAADAKPP